MEIHELINSEHSALETFKAYVWPMADKEHYGENQPNFFKKEFTLIAKENDEIIGYITFVCDSGVAQIEPLMVKTDLKGKGIGSALLKAGEEKAKLMGIHKLWLETGSDWKAKDFYEKNGFSVRVIMPNHTGGREFVLMDKML